MASRIKKIWDQLQAPLELVEKDKYGPEKNLRWLFKELQRDFDISGDRAFWEEQDEQSLKKLFGQGLEADHVCQPDQNYRCKICGKSLKWCIYGKNKIEEPFNIFYFNMDQISETLSSSEQKYRHNFTEIQNLLTQRDMSLFLIARSTGLGFLDILQMNTNNTTKGQAKKGGDSNQNAKSNEIVPISCAYFKWIGGETSNGLEIFADFEGANLRDFMSRDGNCCQITLKSDSNTLGFCEWFCFGVRATSKRFLTIEIVNLRKQTSLYNTGMTCFIGRRHPKTNNFKWERVTSECKYSPSKHSRHNPQFNKTQILSFNQFLKDGEQILISHSVPYTYSDLVDFLENTEKSLKQQNNSIHEFNSKKRQIYIQTEDTLYIKDIISGSRLGLAIFQIEITSPKEKEFALPYEKRKQILILSRQHSSETATSFISSKLIEFLCNGNSIAKQLKDIYVFRIIPMLNPDGVVIGNSRTNISGTDLNRCWKNPNEKKEPEVFFLKEYLKKVYQTKKKELFLFLDIHSSATKQGAFLVGNDDEIGDINSIWVQKRIFSKIIHEQLPSFDWSKCYFSSSTEIESSARVVFSKEFKAQFSYSFVASQYGYIPNDPLSHMQTEKMHHQNDQSNQKQIKLFDVKDYEAIGEEICKALLKFGMMKAEIEEELKNNQSDLNLSKMLKNINENNHEFFHEGEQKNPIVEDEYQIEGQVEQKITLSGNSQIVKEGDKSMNEIEQQSEDLIIQFRKKKQKKLQSSLVRQGSFSKAKISSSLRLQSQNTIINEKVINRESNENSSESNSLMQSTFSKTKKPMFNQEQLELPIPLEAPQYESAFSKAIKLIQDDNPFSTQLEENLLEQSSGAFTCRQKDSPFEKSNFFRKKFKTFYQDPTNTIKSLISQKQSQPEIIPTIKSPMNLLKPLLSPQSKSKTRSNIASGKNTPRNKEFNPKKGEIYNLSAFSKYLLSKSWIIKSLFQEMRSFNWVDYFSAEEIKIKLGEQTEIKETPRYDTDSDPEDDYLDENVTSLLEKQRRLRNNETYQSNDLSRKSPSTYNQNGTPKSFDGFNLTTGQFKGYGENQEYFSNIFQQSNSGQNNQKSRQIDMINSQDTQTDEDLDLEDGASSLAKRESSQSNESSRSSSRNKKLGNFDTDFSDSIKYNEASNGQSLPYQSSSSNQPQIKSKYLLPKLSFLKLKNPFLPSQEQVVNQYSLKNILQRKEATISSRSPSSNKRVLTDFNVITAFDQDGFQDKIAFQPNNFNAFQTQRKNHKSLHLQDSQIFNSSSYSSSFSRKASEPSLQQSSFYPIQTVSTSSSRNTSPLQKLNEESWWLKDSKKKKESAICEAKKEIQIECPDDHSLKLSSTQYSPKSLQELLALKIKQKSSGLHKSKQLSEDSKYNLYFGDAIPQIKICNTQFGPRIIDNAPRKKSRNENTEQSPNTKTIIVYSRNNIIQQDKQILKHQTTISNVPTLQSPKSVRSILTFTKKGQVQFHPIAKQQQQQLQREEQSNLISDSLLNPILNLEKAK